MSRELFDLPLRQRRTYMAAVQLLGDTAAYNHRRSTRSAPGFPEMVFDSDVAFLTGQGLASTRRDLLDLGEDLLIIEQTGEGIWVVAKVGLSRN